MAGLGIAVNFTPSVRNGIQKQEWKLDAHKSDLSPREKEELPSVPAKHCVQDSQSFCYQKRLIASSSETLPSTRYFYK